MKMYLAFVIMIGGLLASACSPARAVPTSTPEPTATYTAVPTSTSSPSVTPTAAITVEFVQSITMDHDPFRLPTDLAFDERGNFYVVDAYNQRIVKFDSGGNFLTTWGSEGAEEGQFHFTEGHDAYGGLDVDSEGNIYVADTFNYRIQKFSGNGQFLSQWGTQGTEDGQFLKVQGVLIDAQGDLYFSDFGRHDIQKFDSEGDIYVADTFNDRIQKFDAGGNFLFKWGGPGIRDGEFSRPYGVALDSNGNVYVTEYKGDRIQVFDGEGRFLPKWGTTGDGELEFLEPSNLQVPPDGKIFIADYQNNRIQVFRFVGN